MSNTYGTTQRTERGKHKEIRKRGEMFSQFNLKRSKTRKPINTNTKKNDKIICNKRQMIEKRKLNLWVD